MITGTLLLHFIFDISSPHDRLPCLICAGNDRFRFEFLTEEHLDDFISLISAMKPTYKKILEDRSTAAPRYVGLPETVWALAAKVRALGGKSSYQVLVQQIIFDQQPLRIRNT